MVVLKGLCHEDIAAVFLVNSLVKSLLSASIHAVHQRDPL